MYPNLIVRCGSGPQRFLPLPRNHFELILECPSSAAQAPATANLGDNLALFVRSPFQEIYFENLPSITWRTAYDVRELLAPDGSVFYVGDFTNVSVAISTLTGTYQRFGQQAVSADIAVRDRVERQLKSRLLLIDAAAHWRVLTLRDVDRWRT